MIFTQNKKYLFFSLVFFSTLFFYNCKSTKTESNTLIEEPAAELIEEESILPLENKKELTLLFAGDIMAHSVNYRISDYSKIWRDVQYLIEPADLAFGNIEAPIDTTQETQNYPNFNMSLEYVQAAIDAGFDVFSLCNNHTNDQNLNGIKETEKTVNKLIETAKTQNHDIYFSGLKKDKAAPFSYNYFEKDGWKILFLPVTEILNRPICVDNINYLEPSSKARNQFIETVKKLRQENPCDLFIISVHACDAEYSRVIPKSQNQFYMDLLDAGIDIVWANHAHIIKDRKYIMNTETQNMKVIMYANGNTISGQRTSPMLKSENPIGERDNTGDGLMVQLTFTKTDDNSQPVLSDSKNYFITTYINTANEYVIKPLNQEFIDYLYSVERTDWAKYIQKRIDINNEYTKDIILWQ